jgi:hypothetical protein
VRSHREYCGNSGALHHIIYIKCDKNVGHGVADIKKSVTFAAELIIAILIITKRRK